MSVIVVGLNHRTAPVELLERMAVPAAGLPKALHDLARARAPRRGRAALDLQPHRDLRALHAVPPGGRRTSATSSPSRRRRRPDDFADHLYTYYDDAAVAHLFGVAAGLDSMIIGEGEILGQVREAWQLAEREGAVGQLLSRVFRQAVEVGKRARTETAIGRHAVSVSSAAVALAEPSGSVARRPARCSCSAPATSARAWRVALVGAGVGEIVVANRTAGAGRRLADAGRRTADRRSTSCPTC